MVTGYFGLPGSGKTTFLTMLAQKELRRIAKGKSKYKYVLCNFHCEGTIYFDMRRDLGNYLIEDALILIDEITLDADSRDFKSFTKNLKLFFLLHRHYNCDIVYFTQMYDNVDKKIRDITFDLFFVKKIWIFSMAKRIFRILDINQDTHEIVCGYRFATLLDKIGGGCTKWCCRPRWYKYFDSWEAPRDKPVLPAIVKFNEGD